MLAMPSLQPQPVSLLRHTGDPCGLRAFPSIVDQSFAFRFAVTLGPKRLSIINFIHSRGGNANSRQVAEHFGWKLYHASYWLGHMHTEGLLDRGRQHHITGFTYTIRIPKVEAPATQWQPPVRIAGRYIRDDAEMAK